MRNTPFFALSLLAAVLASHAATVETSPLWNYTHPEAHVLVGIDLQKARVSPAGKLMMRQLSGQLPKNANSDLLDAVEMVLVSAPIPPGAGLSESSPFVVAIQGRLNPARIKKMMAEGTAVERVRGADLYVAPKSAKSEVVLAMVQEALWLMGDRPTVELVLEAAQTNGGSRPSQALLDRATAMAGVNEFWIVAMPPPEAIAAAAKMSAPPGQPQGPAMPGMKFLEDIENMDLGISLQRGIGLNLGLGMKTDESAKMLAGMAQMGAGMAVQQMAASNPDAAKWLRSLKVIPENKLVRVRMDISMAQLQQGMAGMKTSLARNGPKSIEDFLGMRPGGRPSLGGFPGQQPQAVAQAPAIQNLPPAEPPKPRVPEKRTIRIVGLEDGTREVTYMTGGGGNKN